MPQTRPLVVTSSASRASITFPQRPAWKFACPGGHFPFLPFVLALVIGVLDAGSRRCRCLGHRAVAVNTGSSRQQRGRAAQACADGRLAGLKKFLDAIVIRR